MDNQRQKSFMACSMDMPEFRILVSHHLDRTSLMRACLVNKAWYRDFKPALWRNYRIHWREEDKSDTEHFDDTSPVVIHLRQNIQHVRSVEFPYDYDMVTSFSNLFQVLVDGCKFQLEELRIAPVTDDQWEQFTQLCHNNSRSITRLVWPLDVYCKAEQRYQMLRALPNLKSLEITFEYESPIKDILPLLQELASLEKLESLTLREWHTYPDLVPDLCTSSSTPRPPLDHLKKLTLDMSCLTPHTFELLGRCPRLESFEFDPRLPSDSDSNPVNSLLAMVGQTIRNNMHLHTLSFGVAWECEYEALETLIKYLGQPMPDNTDDHQQIQHLWINTTSAVIPEVVDAIVAPGAGLGYGGLGVNLVSLFLSKVEEDAMLGPIMQNCGKLKTLRLEDAWCRLTEDLVAKPWACTQLEVLHLPILIRINAISHASPPPLLPPAWPTLLPHPGPDQAILALERMFLDRVGSLVHLGKLKLGIECEPWPIYARKHGPARYLLMRLETGLECLKDLKQLWHLDLGGAPFEQGSRELEWMHQHWPRLLALSCDRVRWEEMSWLAKQWPDLRVNQLRPY